MNSFEDLMVFPNYTNLEIKVSYPRLPSANLNIQQKVKRQIASNNSSSHSKNTNETISNILLEVKKVLKSSIFYEEKNSTNNFM